MHVLHRLAALAVTLGLSVAGLAAPAAAAPAPAGPSVPGSLTGYGFDACTAPDQATMDAWRVSSPFSAVGVYLGGSNRLCDDQPHLTPGWVGTQTARGWHLLPLWVGPQASCEDYASEMSSDRVLAEAQGRIEASTAVGAAQALTIGTGSTLWYDLEDYDITDTTCRQAAQSFLSGWTQQLHAQGYRSGVYSNVAAAITSLDNAGIASPGSYVLPDDIWFAWDNGRADVDAGSWVRSAEWDQGERIHQYALDEVQTYGGISQQIDLNWLQIGGGSSDRARKPMCKGVDVDLRKHPNLRAGRRGDAVEALQCLLRKQHHGSVRITGRYDGRTERAVEKAQRKLDLKITGKVTRKTWVALLARGSRPLLKVGSTGEAVHRVQRALDAALGRRVRVDGVFSTTTAQAVAKFQRRRGLEATGNVDDPTWQRLVSGG